LLEEYENGLICLSDLARIVTVHLLCFEETVRDHFDVISLSSADFYGRLKGHYLPSETEANLQHA
jgi:hypothetical protein